MDSQGGVRPGAREAPPRPLAGPPGAPPRRRTRADPRRATQRGRLLDGMLDAAGRYGYAGATVSEVIAGARVSRPTFYEYFADRDACFLALHEELAAELLADVRSALAAAPAAHVARTAACALLARAQQEPRAMRLLCDEALAAPRPVLDARDRLVDRIAGAVDARLVRAESDARAPDLPLAAAFGGLMRVTGSLLRHKPHEAGAAAGELGAVLESYSRPLCEHAWRTPAAAEPPEPSPHVAALALQAPVPIAPGRSRLSRAELQRNQRERILFATAQVAAERGYHASTVADIALAAKLDRRVFYAHFPDREQAFLAAHDMASQQAIGVAATAFFSAADWPKRIWEGVRATTQFYDSHPHFSHIGFVEGHAVGANAIARIEENRRAFTIFLQEGNQCGGAQLSTFAMEAVGAAIFELGYRHARSRHGGAWESARLTGQAAYLALGAFLGADDAQKIVTALNGDLTDTTFI